MKRELCSRVLRRIKTDYRHEFGEAKLLVWEGLGSEPPHWAETVLVSIAPVSTLTVVGLMPYLLTVLFGQKFNLNQQGEIWTDCNSATWRWKPANPDDPTMAGRALAFFCDELGTDP